MESPVERHQLIFLNPDLAGLFTAYLSHRAGAKIAVVDESERQRMSHGNYPPPFPVAGTFHPHDVNILASEAGFPPPVWERVTKFKFYITDWHLEIDSTNGAGGFILAVARLFPRSKSVWSEWLQEHLKKAIELGKAKGQPRTGRFKRLEKSVAESIQELGIEDPEILLLLFDVLSILTVGRGIVQLDIRDLPIVLAGLLTGWHIPARDQKDWREILRTRLQKEGARWHDIESVASVQLLGNRLNVIRCSNGSLQAARILVVPQDDRFTHPAVLGESNAIKWENWHGQASDLIDSEPVVGVIRSSESRPPINDNFITYHLRPGKNSGLYTASAPLEERLLGENRSNLYEITMRARVQIKHNLGWKLEELSDTQQIEGKPIITLPGHAPSVSFPEGPLWGDDILTRLKAADRLSRRLVASLK